MINEFQTYLTAIRGYSKNTAIAYGKDLRQFARFIKTNQPDKRWSTITREDVDAYVIYLSNTGHKPATLCRHIASIDSIYKYMKREGKDVVNPAQYESRPKIGKKQPNTIPLKDLEQAISSADGLARIIIKIMLETGVRVQELLDITKADVDLGNGRIKVRGKGNKERLVYISETTRQQLRMWCNGSTDKLFGALDQREVRRIVYMTLKRYSSAKQLSPHAIRHTYATEMARRGMTATTLQKALGHQRLETTQRYIDYGQIHHEAEVRQLSLFN